MGWLDTILTKTFGPKNQPKVSFGEVAHMMAQSQALTIEHKGAENVPISKIDIGAAFLTSTLAAPGRAGKAVDQGVAKTIQAAKEAYKWTKIGLAIAAVLITLWVLAQSVQAGRQLFSKP